MSGHYPLDLAELLGQALAIRCPLLAVTHGLLGPVTAPARSRLNFGCPALSDLVWAELRQQKGLTWVLSLLTFGFTCLSPLLFLPSLSQPMKPLKATATTSQPVLTIQQIETIFYKIQDIYEIHKEFYDNLCPKVQQWDSQVTMGHLFQKLVSLPLVEGAYVGPQWSRWCCKRTDRPQTSLAFLKAWVILSPGEKPELLPCGEPASCLDSQAAGDRPCAWVPLAEGSRAGPKAPLRASADGGARAGWMGRHLSPETSDVLLPSMLPLK